MNFYFKTLEKGLWKDFVAYFEFKGSCSGCWCMNHRLPIGLDFEGEAAKLAMEQLVKTNRVFGVLAYVEGDDVPVGWASLDRRKTLPGHDCIGEDIQCSEDDWSIHCITSRRDFKSKGVEEFLMKVTTGLAKDYNAAVVEAYPEPGSETTDSFKTWNTFSGTEKFLSELGYDKIKKDFGCCSKFYLPMKKEL